MLAYAEMLYLQYVIALRKWGNGVARAKVIRSNYLGQGKGME